MASTSSLVRSMLKGDKASLSRLITIIENDHPETSSIMREIFPYTGRAHIIGITGFPGVGKSTIIDKLISIYRGQGLSVGVIAVDPSSSISGGAILGDRIRMRTHHKDENVFIRSMATRGFLGGLSRNTRKAMGLLDASGLNKVIIETVGVGQDEIDIVGLAHTCAVILMPGLGDNIQAIKAGIFEIADMFVINKTDRLDPTTTLSDLESLINSKHTDNVWIPRVILTSAKEGKGIGAFAKTLDSHYEAWKELSPNRSQRKDREIDAIIHEALLDLFKKRLGTDYAKFKRKLINGGVDIYGLIENVMYPGRGGSGQK